MGSHGIGREKHDFPQWMSWWLGARKRTRDDRVNDGKVDAVQSLLARMGFGIRERGRGVRE